MIKIAVAGARGRMGARICALTFEHEGLELAGAFEVKGHEDIGKDVGPFTGGSGETGVAISEDASTAIKHADVVIDFTHPEPTMENVRAALAAAKAMVIGTTGLTAEHMAEIEAASKSIPMVVASNMSLGVNLLFKVLGDVALALGDDYDIEIVEAHHRMKKDAPSGTALRMARVMADALGRDLDDVGVYARHGMIGERGPKEIGIQTIRAGDIVGEHTVLFGGLGERIEITHRASSRDTFARGALRAALWLESKGAGLYDMQDVLGLK